MRLFPDSKLTGDLDCHLLVGEPGKVIFEISGWKEGISVILLEGFTNFFDLMVVLIEESMSVRVIHKI